MPLLDQNQIAAQEIQKLLTEDNRYNPSRIQKCLKLVLSPYQINFPITIEGKTFSTPSELIQSLISDLTLIYSKLSDESISELNRQGVTLANIASLNPSALSIFNEIFAQTAGLAPKAFPSNIPKNLQELVTEAELIAEARTAAQQAQKVGVSFDLKSQIDRAVKINQQVQTLRTNTTGRLFHLLQKSSYVKDLQTIYGRDNVNKVLWDRLDAAAEQSITTLTVNQAGLLNQDPSRAAAYFTKQLEKIIKNDDLLPTALAKTKKSEQKEVLKNIQKQTEQVVQELKPVAAEFQAEQVKAPTNQESALKIAAEKIALPEKQRQVFFRELQKNPDNQPAIIARVFPDTTPAERDQLHKQISPLLSAPRYPTLAELQNQNSLVALVRTHPQLFPRAVVSQIISGQLSTPQESALLQAVANHLGIPLDVATLYRAGLNPINLIINHFDRLASGKKVLGLFSTQPRADKTHPVIAEIDRHLEQFSKIDSALQNIPPVLPQSPFREFKKLSRQTSLSVKREQRFDSLRLDQSFRYGINNIRSFQSTGRSISSFISALRVRSAPVNFVFNSFTSLGGGFRSLPQIITSPFRAAGNFVSTRIFTPVKTQFQTTVRSAGAKMAAWGLTKVGGSIFRRGMARAAVRLGIALGGKALGAAFAQAVPVVGQIIGAVSILSMIGDVAKLAWQNREAIAKNIANIGLGLLSSGLIFVSHLLGALGAAAWGLGVGTLLAVPAWIIGGPVLGIPAFFAGNLLGHWIGSGGFSSALSATGAWLGNATAGIGNFIAGLSAPISSSIITTITTWSVLGGLGVVTTAAIIKNIQQKTALIAFTDRYFNAGQGIFPEGLVNSCLPDNTGKEITSNLASLTSDGVVNLLPESNGARNPSGRFCITPTMLVIHWSGGYDNNQGNESTYETLINRDLACHLSTDTNDVWFMQPFYEKQVEMSWCSNSWNTYSISNEVSGKNFTSTPPPPDLSELEKAYDVTCVVMKQYQIPWCQIFGHYQVPDSGGKIDPGEDFLQNKFIPDIKKRCPNDPNNICEG